MNILVCYDGSPLSKKALSTGIKIGNALDAEVHIFSSISPKKDSNEVFEFIKNETQKDIENAAKEAEKACEIVKETGLVCKTHITIEEINSGEDIIN